MMNISSVNNHGMAIKNDHLKALVFALLMLASGFAILAMLHIPTPVSTSDNSRTAVSVQTPVKLDDSKVGVMTGSYDSAQAVDPNMQVSIMVALSYQNMAQLNQFLIDVQNPLSSQYHHFLTQNQFVNAFAPSVDTYNGLTSFFTQHGLKIKSYTDRIAINLEGTFGQMESVFHTKIYNYKVGSESFYAPGSSLTVDTQYGNSITTIQGLNNRWQAKLNPLFAGSGSGETLYGTDMQTAYQLDQLYTAGFPSSVTIVTILWSGHKRNQNQLVSAFYPADIANYLSQVIPAGQPQPTILGDPIGGAPAPGIDSTQDTTQANYESTLDLEMVGSMAPGATVIEVYGPQATTTYLDQCFAEVLNPSASSPAALQNTVAISNSWGGSDSLDSLWTSYEQQAAARGITVLASSGDNGKTTTPSFPATSAYDSYGTIAVGGTTTVLSGTASIDGTGTTGIQSQTVWWNTPSAGDGSQSGVSSVYAEPSWQSSSSDANGVITAVRNGRGTADIAGVGANMEIWITSSSGTASMITLWGTSVACPLVAGQVAVMDNYMGSLEGFFAPTIYQLGQAQYDGQYSTAQPFWDINSGATQAYPALNGYDLPTGWGSINSYNFIQAQTGGLATYSVTFTESGLTSGTSWSVTLGTQTQSSTTSTITFTETDGSYSYTVNGVSGYTSSPSSGTVSVSGADVNTAVTFTPATTYTVSFTESGLSSGTSWSVTLAGSTQSSTSSTISFTEVAGSYSYTVNAVSGYTASPSSGSVSVTSSNVNIGVTFTAVATPSVVAYSYVEGPASYYSLPEAEQFNVGSSSHNVNFISLILSGSGSVSVSIGSALWGTDVLASQTVSVVSTQTNYTVSFPSVNLAGSTSYYLSVQLVSGSVQWAYTTAPTSQVGATLDYWYNHHKLASDNSYPDLYSVGYNSNGPAVIVPSAISSTSVSSAQMITRQATTVSVRKFY